MNEKLESAINGLKNMAEKAHLQDKLNDLGDKIGEAGDKIKAAASEKSAELKQSLRENPGAAIDNADSDKVSECLEKERTSTLNNNPRNNDMDNM